MSLPNATEVFRGFFEPSNPRHGVSLISAIATATYDSPNCATVVASESRTLTLSLSVYGSEFRQTPEPFYEPRMMKRGGVMINYGSYTGLCNIFPSDLFQTRLWVVSEEESTPSSDHAICQLRHNIPILGSRPWFATYARLRCTRQQRRICCPSCSCAKWMPSDRVE